MTPFLAIGRVLVILLIAGGALTAIRFAILFLYTPSKRREIAAEQGVDAFAPSVEAPLADWRVRFGNRLWLGLVGIPLGVFLVLLYVGEYM